MVNQPWGPGSTWAFSWHRDVSLAVFGLLPAITPRAAEVLIAGIRKIASQYEVRRHA